MFRRRRTVRRDLAKATFAMMVVAPLLAGIAFFLWTLRHLLVQDWDTDDDGKPDALRLLYSIPRRWLRGGAVIRFEDAPTAFGKLSLETESRLSQGELLVRIALPPQHPKTTLLRACARRMEGCLGDLRRQIPFRQRNGRSGPFGARRSNERPIPSAQGDRSLVMT